MKITTRGTGDPEVAVVGAVHGDEPCGARAIERLLASDLKFERPTKFVVVNEEALERGVRFVDVDLNQVLPGDPNADEHERRLAAQLVQEVEGCFALGIHSTHSFNEPFGVLSNPTDRKRKVFRRMAVDQVVDTTGLSEGRCVDQPRFVDVEVGPQGTEKAVEQAEHCVRSFLATVGAIPGSARPTPTDYYEVTEIEEKQLGSEYEFLARNFSKVEAGETYARRDGEELVADESFWPVLASAGGHDTILGYRAQLVGEL